MADEKMGVGMRLATPFLALVAGIPVLIGVYIESAVIAAVTGWDTWTVFLVQAIPMTAIALIAGIGMALTESAPDR